jgi:antitoxin HicB
MEVLETDEGFVVTNPDLPGCQSYGDTLSEAVDNLAEVRSLWLEGHLKENGEAPEPRAEEDYSGKFLVRVPKWLHRKLERTASREGSSLNQFIVSLLAWGVVERDSKNTIDALRDRVDLVSTLMGQQLRVYQNFCGILQPHESVEYDVKQSIQHATTALPQFSSGSYYELATPQDEETLDYVWSLPSRFNTKIRTPLRRP